MWVNEKLTTDTFTGFTSKGFGIPMKSLHAFIDALNAALTSNNFEKDFIISDSMKLVVHNPDASTVDIRYYRTSDNYTGYLKKGIRVIKANAEEIRDALLEIAR